MPAWAPNLTSLQVGDGGGALGRRALEGDDGLVARVVRDRHVDVLLALVADRVLLQVHVEVLRAGLDGLVERGAGPHDGVALVAHLGGDGERDGGLETLPGLRRIVDHPGEEGRLAGGDRQRAVLDAWRRSRPPPPGRRRCRSAASEPAGRGRVGGACRRSCRRCRPCRRRCRTRRAARAPTARAGTSRRTSGWSVAWGLP